MRWAIWYHSYDLKNEKNTHGGVLLLVKLQVKSLMRRNNIFLYVSQCWKHTKINQRQICFDANEVTFAP